jgi:hypothetical protein
MLADVDQMSFFALQLMGDNYEASLTETSSLWDETNLKI